MKAMRGGEKEGMGGEVKEWVRRWHGKGSTFHNLRKNDPRHQMAGYGPVCAPNFYGARPMGGYRFWCILALR